MIQTDNGYQVRVRFGKVSMPVRAFLDSDAGGVGRTAAAVLEVSMPVRAFLDSDWLDPHLKQWSAFCFNARQGIS